MEATPEKKHWRRAQRYLKDKTGFEIMSEYNDLNGSRSFTTSSQIFPKPDGKYDAFIYYTHLED